jgi:hypothetical protein
MSKSQFLESNRRQFITRVIPACAAGCFGCGLFPALAASGQESASSEAEHMFDNEFERKLTYRQFYASQYRAYIRLAKALSQDLGKDKTLELLKKYTAERMLRVGQAQAKRSPDDKFSTYVAMFKDPEGYKNTLTKEAVEDTDTVLELKVTECIWASTFLAAEAGDIGYAGVCYGDYAWAEGFNPRIKMIRDKTLMQGHDCCNHRYIYG